MVVRKSLRRWEFVGFLFVCALGTLLQFLFRWTGGNTLIGAFSAVNESTWEHMKLLFLPYFVFTMVQYTVFAEPYRNFFAVKAVAGLAGLLMIPLLHYTIWGMFGVPPDWINVAIFYVSVAAMYLLSCRLLNTFALRGGLWQAVGFALLWALVFLFVFFTYRTPRLPLFLDPVTGQYGIPR